MAEIAAISSVLSSQQLERSDALNFIVERACSLTGASGGALALQEQGEIVCLASSGQAPPLNSRLRPESGISGECLRTGRSLLCEDTHTDARVDREVCDALGIRATAVVPLGTGTQATGLLEVFAREPHVFRNDHIGILRTLGEIAMEQVHEADDKSSSSGPSERKPPQHDFGVKDQPQHK